MSFQTWQHDDYTISTDKSKLDVRVIQAFLSSTYWASSRTRETIENSIENSLCFGVYEHQSQIGFARVISDYAITSYIFDVFIIPSHQSLGLGKWLIKSILSHTHIKNTTIVLATKDKHDFYHQFGFLKYECPERIMVLKS